MEGNEGTPPAGERAPASPASDAEKTAVRSELSAMLAKQREERAARERGEGTEEPVKPNGKPATPPKEEPEGEPAEEEPEPAEEGEEPEEEDKPPESAARGLAAIAKREKALRTQEARFKSELASARQEITKLRSDAEKEIQAAKDFAKRAKSDPIGALSAAIGDMSPEDLDYFGRQFHLRAKGATSPEHRAQAERERRDREAASTAKTAAERVEALEKELQAEREGRALEEQRREYITTVEHAASEESTPLLTRALKSNPKQTRAELREVGGWLAQRDGINWPKAADVAAGWESWKRHKIATEFGQDAVDRLLTKAGTAKQTPVGDPNRRPSKTINAGLGSATQPRPEKPRTREDEIAETLREIREGRAKGEL